MVENIQHFQHIMLYYFKKIKSATETQKKICAVYEKVTDETHQKWFVKFCTGDFLPETLHCWVDELKLTEIKLRH